MEFPTFQRTVTHFVETNKLEIPVQFRLLDLASEIGEVAKEALKATNYGHSPFQITNEWADELGDVLFSLICVANSTDVNLEEALNRVLNKYETRLASTHDASSGQ